MMIVMSASFAEGASSWMFCKEGSSNGVIVVFNVVDSIFSRSKHGLKLRLVKTRPPV